MRVPGDCLPRHFADAYVECRELDLSECRGISGSALHSALAGAMPALESVMLTGIPEVSNALLQEMALGVSMRYISIARCTAISDEGLRGLAAACPQLLTLQADACIKITDAGIVALSESCRELQVGIAALHAFPLHTFVHPVARSYKPLSCAPLWQAG